TCTPPTSIPTIIRSGASGCASILRIWASLRCRGSLHESLDGTSCKPVNSRPHLPWLSETYKCDGWVPAYSLLLFAFKTTEYSACRGTLRLVHVPPRSAEQHRPDRVAAYTSSPILPGLNPSYVPSTSTAPRISSIRPR